MPLPPSDNFKPALLVRYKVFPARDIVFGIVKDVDRFYKPQTFCRRKFTLNGVDKYYPQRDVNLLNLYSFLYRNKHNVDLQSLNNFNANKLLQIGDPSQNNYNWKVACENFILAERYAIYLSYHKENIRSRRRVDTFYMLDSPININFRNKKRVSLQSPLHKSFSHATSNHNSVSVFLKLIMLQFP